MNWRRSRNSLVDEENTEIMLWKENMKMIVLIFFELCSREHVCTGIEE